MTLPLPTGTLYQIQHKYWDNDTDWSRIDPREAMELQDKAYRGAFKKPLRRTDEREPDHNVLDNRCEPIVSTGIDFLYGDELTWEVLKDDGETPDEPAQEHLDAVWDANTKMPLLAEYEITSANFGHGFLKLDPDDADMPLAPNGTPIPAILVQNPMQMSVTTAPANIRKVQRYAFSYQDVDPVSQRIADFRQLTERDLDMNGRPLSGWRVVDQIRRTSGTGNDSMSMNAVLTLLAPKTQEEDDRQWETVSTMDWPYAWAPIHDAKNMAEPNSYWGKADLRLDLIHLNDVLNFLLSNRQRILYYHGHPQDWGFGFHARDIDVSPGGMPCIPNINAKVQHIEMTGDLGALNLAIEDVRESMDELSHVPALAIGRLKNLPGVPSGVGMKVACRPLIAQTQQKRTLRTAMLIKLNQHILELGGFGADRKVVLHWSDMLPTDDLQSAQEAQIWVSALGVSQDSAMQRMSPPFDPDVERRKKQQEAQVALAHQAAVLALQPSPQQDSAPGQSAGQGSTGEESSPSQQTSQAPSQNGKRVRRPTGTTRGRQGLTT